MTAGDWGLGFILLIIWLVLRNISKTLTQIHLEQKAVKAEIELIKLNVEQSVNNLADLIDLTKQPEDLQ